MVVFGLVCSSISKKGGERGIRSLYDQPIVYSARQVRCNVSGVLGATWTQGSNGGGGDDDGIQRSWEILTSFQLSSNKKKASRLGLSSRASTKNTM